MRQWSWVPHKGSSWGSGTTVESRGTKLQSVGVVVSHHTSTEDKHINRQPKDPRSPKKKDKKVNLILYRVL